MDIRLAIKTHSGINAQLPRLLCSKDPKISAAANNLQISLQSVTPTQDIHAAKKPSLAADKATPQIENSPSDRAAKTRIPHIQFKPFIPPTPPAKVLPKHSTPKRLNYSVLQGPTPKKTKEN